jgi:hypothetical protein
MSVEADDIVVIDAFSRHFGRGVEIALCLF